MTTALAALVAFSCLTWTLRTNADDLVHLIHFGRKKETA